MAAEMVSSAIVEETVSRIVSSISRKGEGKTKTSENIERLELAHIKMEAALQISNKWQISDMPLLRWRRKLKRAAQECDETLHQCKQRAIEEEGTRHQFSRSSFPKRIAYATKSFVSSFIGFGDDNKLINSDANVRRFERLADGANEFLQFVEFGGTPRQYMLSNPIVSQLLAGKSLRYQLLQGSKFCCFGIRPMYFAERGAEAMIGLISIDFKAPTKGFSLAFMLRISESTDILGVIIKCMQSVTPHFMFAAEGAKRELFEMPRQDIGLLVPQSLYGKTEYWDNVHGTLTQWYRPNPLCCTTGHEHNLTTSSSTISTNASSSTSASPSSSSSRLLCGIFPEEVVVMFLQCHVTLPDDQKNRLSSTRSTEPGAGRSMNSEMYPLKMGIMFMPHDSPEDIEPGTESYALEVIDKKEQEVIHTNAFLGDLVDKLLPKARDYLYKNVESKMYQMCLRSGHGTAHICLEKTSTGMRSSRRSRATRQVPNRYVTETNDSSREDQWKLVTKDMLKIWVLRASDKLQGPIMSWAAQHNFA